MNWFLLHPPYSALLLSLQLSQKGSLHLDGQVATPASVSSSSADTSSQQAPCDGAVSGLSTKMEVKQQDDEEEDEDDEESATGGRIGKLGGVKTEEKPDVSIM